MLIKFLLCHALCARLKCLAIGMGREFSNFAFNAASVAFGNAQMALFMAFDVLRERVPDESGFRACGLAVAPAWQEYARIN